MAQGPFQRAIQRIADALGVLAPEQRAVRFISPFTIRNVPETQAGSTLRGTAGSGEVTGYTEVGIDTSLLPGIVTSRIVFGTNPIRINGGASDDLAASNITVSINPATGLSAGSFSADDFTKLAGIAAGAAVSNVTGAPPIVVTPAGTVRDVSITPASATDPGSMSSTHYTRLENILIADMPTSIQPNDTPDTGAFAHAARTDHRHGIGTGSAGSIVPDDTPAEGVSTNFARADHRHGITTAVAGTIALGDTPAEGSGSDFARADHRHGMPALAINRELGANTLTGTTTVRYLVTGFNTGTASLNAIEMAVTKAFSIAGMRLWWRVAGTAGANISFFLRKNGAQVATAVLTVASDAAANTVYTATFTAATYAAGDTWSVEVTKSAGIAQSPSDVMLTVQQILG